LSLYESSSLLYDVVWDELSPCWIMILVGGRWVSGISKASAVRLPFTHDDPQEKVGAKAMPQIRDESQDEKAGKCGLSYASCATLTGRLIEAVDELRVAGPTGGMSRGDEQLWPQTDKGDTRRPRTKVRLRDTDQVCPFVVFEDREAVCARLRPKRGRGRSRREAG
jgi:hypothetical protein